MKCEKRTESSIVTEESQHMSESQNIEFACYVGDKVIEYLTEEGLIEKKVLLNLDIDGNVIENDDDPTGFTEQGRDLFEFGYNLIKLF